MDEEVGGSGSGASNASWFNDRRFTLTSPATRIRDNLTHLVTDVQQVARQNPELLGVIHQQLQLLSQISRAGAETPAPPPPPPPQPPSVLAQSPQTPQTSVTTSTSPPDSIRLNIASEESDSEEDEEEDEDEVEEEETGPRTPNSNPNANGNANNAGAGDDWSRLVELLRSEEFRRLFGYFLRAAPYLAILLLHVTDVVTSSVLSLGLLFAPCLYGNVVAMRVNRPVRGSRSCEVLKGWSFLGACWALYYWGWGWEMEVLRWASLAGPDMERPLNLGRVLWTLGAADWFVVGVLVGLKLCVLGLWGRSGSGWGSGRRRGRVLQALEYSGQLYRHWLPLRPWLSYFLTHDKYLGWLVLALYFVLKVVEARWKLWRWWISVSSLLRGGGEVGRAASAEAIKSASVCSICFGDFGPGPRQLSCGHVFCGGCVGEWLEREASCPMCRAPVPHDPDWRNGATNLLPHII